MQNLLLLANAILVWWYVRETSKIRQASQDQLVKTEALIRVGQSQFESQSQPAITATFQGGTIHLINIGSGPAVLVELARVEQNSHPNFGLGSNEAGRVFSHIETRGEIDTRVASTWLAAPRASLQCRYRSPSGRTYVSVIDAKGADVMDARFYDKPA